MRDDDLRFVELVHRQLADVRWPEPTELRGRARRRSRRTAMAAAVAVLVVAGGTAVAVAEPPGPGRTSLPLARPPVAASAEVPAEALLSRADPAMKTLEATADIQLGESGLGEPVRVDTWLETCARSHGAAVQPVASRYSRSQNLLENLAAGQSNTPRPVLAQDVYRTVPGTARRVFDDLDRFVALCATWQAPPAQRNATPVLHRWQITDRGFAGDRAVVLRHTESQGTSGHIVRPDQKLDVRVVVQVGDLVTVIMPDMGGMVYPTGVVPWTTDQQLRTLARGAAARLCPAANPRC
ncbi:hypothetical protein ONA70_01515 [Micromonospora yasonensis]|uniref:hypothetical protein n=1 Tax=Micromonospora yasonensis TaxID=1128667 RepID=UPI00222F4050|nr:hypothetical protein [Micromonospora yasonensis]MCW3838777.1 hypothetical protein [Micromonospora yasonensis]